MDPLDPNARQGTVDAEAGQFARAAADAAAQVAQNTGTIVAAINAGGGALTYNGIAFEADRSFTPSRTYTDQANGNGEQPTFDDTIYETERYGQQFGYTIDDLTPGTDYTIELHFAEIYWEGEGERIFDVAIEGETVLDELDLNARTGDVNAPFVFTSQPVRVGANGTLDVDFSTTVDNAKISAIIVREVQAETTAPNPQPEQPAPQPEQPSPQPEQPTFVDPTPSAAGSVVAAVNAGGGALTYNGIMFAADTGFSASNTYTDWANGNGIQPVYTGTIYETERYGREFGYTIDNLDPNADYVVELHFAEIFWGGEGQRVFDVVIEGETVLDKLDLNARTGDMNAPFVFTSQPVRVGANGTLDIDFSTTTNNAKISAIVVREAGAQTPTPSPGPATPAGSALDSAFTFEAESGALDGPVVATDNAGFSGAGFVDYLDPTNDSVEWIVEADRAGPIDLSVRYALGSAASRTMALEVNGVVVNDAVTFTQTGTWDDWRSLTLEGIALEAGDNSLRLLATGDSGPNIDLLTAAPPGSDSAAPELRGVTTGTGTLPDGATGVPIDSSFAIGIVAETPDDTIEAASVTTSTVTLTREDGVAVAGTVNTTGGRDAISFTPNAPLEPNTGYTLRVDGVRNEAGEAYAPLTRDFTTGTEAASPNAPTEVAFDRRVVSEGDAIASVTVAPDNQRLYATTLTGDLLRWDIDQATGDLSNQQTITLPGNRALIGMAFDPSDPNRLWFTNNDTVFGFGEAFTGKISYIDIAPGAAFDGEITDYVQGLPRSTRDHLTNGLDFGPDGALYVTQGGNSAMGAPDNAWGNRPESLLSAAVLRVDPTLDAPAGGFDVRTDETGDYDPTAPGAPVTLFGTGLRNSYDLEWHSNGQLYVANNGSNTGGNSPDDPSTARDEGLTDGFKQPDYLYLVTQGGYYGHPNPSRGEYIRDGGNPTAGVDVAEVVTTEGREGYDVGVEPEPNYRGFAYDFGFNRSPNGTVEYRSNAFGGALANKLLVVEYSGGDRILALTPEADGTISGTTVVASGFNNPLDLTVHEPSGRIYLAEQLDRGSGTDDRLVLLEPNSAPSA